ncbi:hypothetical protein CDD80_3560 [Ophiocordyceps camponoti-rufipedis]|uniref:Origin recognition complex subunit 4 n=1 Tax=Ophiocordyceps camponoti-rufipedis TaxID=2004952 RepID=A0A2C5Z1T7_9HYPO|nr:hypothetical protein CDD80_3560 [Ophiocordyceps camponoti-rufipedis]
MIRQHRVAAPTISLLLRPESEAGLARGIASSNRSARRAMPPDAVNSSEFSYFLGFIPTLPVNDMTVSTPMVLQDDEDDDEEDEEEALSIIDNALKSVWFPEGYWAERRLSSQPPRKSTASSRFWKWRSRSNKSTTSDLDAGESLPWSSLPTSASAPAGMSSAEVAAFAAGFAASPPPLPSPYFSEKAHVFSLQHPGQGTGKGGPFMGTLADEPTEGEDAGSQRTAVKRDSAAANSQATSKNTGSTLRSSISWFSSTRRWLSRAVEAASAGSFDAAFRPPTSAKTNCNVKYSQFPGGEAVRVSTPPLDEDTADGKPRGFFTCTTPPSASGRPASPMPPPRSVASSLRHSSVSASTREWWEPPRQRSTRPPVTAAARFQFDLPEHLPSSPLCPANRRRVSTRWPGTGLDLNLRDDERNGHQLCAQAAEVTVYYSADASMDPPSGRKRQVTEAASTPASSKRRRLDDANAQSPTTPQALKTTASMAPSASPQPIETNGQSAARPAIKLAALKGTKWDRGDIGDARMSRQPSTPTRVSARSSPSSRRAASTSKRAAGRPSGRAVAEAVVDDGDELGRSPAKLRGILTPSKNRVRRLKSVTFNRGDEVYFEDLPKSASATKTRASKAKQAKAEVEEEADDDEIRCGICSKADSRPPNQIILCDNCDFATHLACYDLPDIPEGDWLCKSCRQEDAVQMTSKPATVPDSDAAEVPDIANLDQHLRSLQRVLLDRCCGRRRIRMCGLEECYDQARQLVEQTVVAAEGNSMLLIGPRGCGKTTMVENMIVDLSREHRHLFHVVRLSGFIHTDDKVALKEIWRQLGKEMEVEDELVNRTNYADTLASLLALLSHPSEISGADTGVTSQSVIFIIDEFDMFACHGRQTLLYNLLDIAQSRKAPIAVLGCTTRLDVVEMLEKRVKSRFSHRCVYVSPPRSLAAFWQVCRQGLMVDWHDVGAEGIDAGLDGYDDFHRYWTMKIEVR